MLDLLDKIQFIEPKKVNGHKGHAKYKEWTLEEEAILKRCYAKSPKESLLTMLRGRSWSSIKVRATRLGLKRDRDQITVPKGLRWRRHEENILIDNWAHGSKVSLLRKLPNHSWSAISTKASKLDLVRHVGCKRWTDTELNTVDELHTVGRTETRRRLVRFTYTEIYRKARERGLAIDLFPEYDRELLKQMAARGDDMQEMARMLDTSVIMISRALKGLNI